VKINSDIKLKTAIKLVKVDRYMSYSLRSSRQIERYYHLSVERNEVDGKEKEKEKAKAPPRRATNPMFAMKRK